MKVGIVGYGFVVSKLIPLATARSANKSTCRFNVDSYLVYCVAEYNNWHTPYYICGSNPPLYY